MQTLQRFQELGRGGGIAVAFARKQLMMVSLETIFWLSAAEEEESQIRHKDDMGTKKIDAGHTPL